MHILHLASPLLRSGEVTAAQRALANNRFGHFAPGPIDGQYGAHTAAAARRAQYAAGFRTHTNSYRDGDYGPDLHRVLTGGKLSPAQATRRRLRQWRARQTPGREKALKLALTQVGVTESPPDSNMTKYGAWYGWNGVSWCAIFCSWSFSHVGRPMRYAYCPYILADAIQGRNGLSLTAHPVAGDLVLYDWDRDRVPDHVGIVHTPPTNGVLVSVEGNTSMTDQSNGGQVMVRTRGVQDVRAYIHVS